MDRKQFRWKALKNVEYLLKKVKKINKKIIASKSFFTFLPFYLFTFLPFYLYPMSDVTFNIYGGNNQILPNATKAEQNFYGDQFAEKTLAKDGEAPQPLTEEEQALSYI